MITQPTPLELWACDAYDGMFYIEGQSPVCGWFCMELDTPADLIEQLGELGFIERGGPRG